MFAGALAIPLGFEILWRFDGVAGSHQQPEVATVEVGGQDLVRGQDPYRPLVNLPHPVKYHAPGEPDFAGFLPYLPLMAVARHPERHLAQQRAQRRADLLLPDDARRGRGRALPVPGRRAPQDPRLQALIILPLASLPLATGGDDIPVVAFLLLAMVLAQRRRPFASGVVLGIASAMKFTAWPLAVLALFAAAEAQRRAPPAPHAGRHDRRGRPHDLPLRPARAVRADRRRRALPLGLSAIPSTAASALPGHVLVSRLPSLSRALPLSVGLVLAVLLARHLYRHTPEHGVGGVHDRRRRDVAR